MKIIITEPELTQIVRSHVLSTVQLQNGSDIAIDFSATRGADGVTATIDIPYVGVAGLDLDTAKFPQKEADAPVQEKTKARAPRAQAPAAPAAVEAGVGIFAGAQAAADAAVVGLTPPAAVEAAPFELATGSSASDTAAAAAEGTAVEPAPSAGVSLFP